MGAERRTPCLIGRDGERAEIARFLDRVGDLPAALVLRGEMGAGKTTLLDDVVQQALARSYRVLRAAPAEPERDLSFGVLRDLFDQAFELVADRLPAPQRTALAVALLREEPGEGYHGAAAVAASTLSALRALSMLGPVLLVIDDAQWMDRATADVLGFALRRLRAEPVGLALVQRLSGDEPLPSPLDGWPAERTVLLSIGPLSMGAVHVLLLEHLGISLPRPLLRRVHSTSGGNPFFALEIGRVLASGAPPLDEPLPMPVTLRGLLRQRLSALPTAVREVLAVASAMTRPTVAAIEELVGGSAAELLEEAADAGILAVDDERVRFTHPLLAAQAYAEIPPAARRRLHRRLVATATDPVDRARHLALAVSGPDPEVAAALEHAASAAARRGVPRMAGDLAERAADLTPRGGDAEAGRRRLQAARFHFLAGDTERARDILTALVEGSPPGGVRSEALATLGRIHLFTDDLDRAAALLAEAVAGAGGSDRLRAEVEEGL
ncbi:MAG TPA: AAA family ATPase, partial [Actinomycetota bacterium]|nr:AAA family ATPase [Actinomycetota bacterium]